MTYPCIPVSTVSSPEVINRPRVALPGVRSLGFSGWGCRLPGPQRSGCWARQEGFLKTVTGLGLAYLKEPRAWTDCYCGCLCPWLGKQMFGSILGFLSTVRGLSSIIGVIKVPSDLLVIEIQVSELIWTFPPSLSLSPSLQFQFESPVLAVIENQKQNNKTSFLQILSVLQTAWRGHPWCRTRG